VLDHSTIAQYQLLQHQHRRSQGFTWAIVKNTSFPNFRPICQFCKKVARRLSEHGDVIKINNKSLSPQSFLANLVLAWDAGTECNDQWRTQKIFMGFHSVAYGGHLYLGFALCDVTIWRHIPVSKPTFWRSLLT